MTEELPLNGDNALTEEGATEVEPWRIALIIGLVALSGAFSGLNLGVLSLDVQSLNLLRQSPFEDKEEE
jgi:hypothetical protein